VAGFAGKCGSNIRGEKKNMKIARLICMVAIAAAGAVFASGAIVSGSIARECDFVADVSTSGSEVSAAGVGSFEVEASEGEPLDCRAFTCMQSNVMSTLDCTPPPYFLILVK
jgi:hypothetical protein